MKMRLPLALILSLGFVKAALAQDLVADLTTHVIGITSRFQGASLVAFGAVEGGGDVVITISGPERDMMIRHKSRIAGIWLNTEGVGFADIPSFYRVLSDQPVETLMPLTERKLNGIGSDAMAFSPQSSDAGDPKQRLDRFKDALVTELEGRGFYAQKAQRPVEFLGRRLFRASLEFPANIPVGTYDVTAFLIRHGAVVASQSIPLIISRSGFEAGIHDFADNYALLFGIFAVMGSAVVGWLGSSLFRSV